jgi:hypothetical protein
MKWKPERKLTRSDLATLLKISIDVEEQSLYQLSVEIKTRLNLIKTIPDMIAIYKKRRLIVRAQKKELRKLQGKDYESGTYTGSAEGL